MRNGNVLGFARVIGLSALLLAACGDDEEAAPVDAGGSGGMGGGSGGTSGGGTGGSAPTGLGDDVAGKACTDSEDCGGAMCATMVPGTMLGSSLPAPGGYCTATCASDADCGAGGACIITLANGGGLVCLDICTSVSDCRDGYECDGGGMIGNVTVPDTCRPATETDQLGDDVAGKMCASDDDCSGGACLTTRFSLAGEYELPGGYCSGDCLEDAHCGAGGVCLPALPIIGGAGSCYEECATDTDCTRDGYRCRPLRDGIRGCNVAAPPLPDNTTGIACADDAACGGNEGSCASEIPRPGIEGLLGEADAAPGGYCTQGCLEDIDCGAGGTCVGGGLGAGICLASCNGGGCRAGYVCEDRAIMSFDPDAGPPDPLTVCVPDAGDEDGGI